MICSGNKSNQPIESRYLDMGNLYLDKRKHDLAADQFNAVLEINPGNEYAYQGLGHVYLQKGQYGLALERFKKALEIDDKNSFVRQGLGAVYFEQGLYDEAEKEFKETIRLNDNNMFAHRMLGYIYKRKGNDDLAVSEFINATNLYLAAEDIKLKSKGTQRCPDGKTKAGLSVKILRMPDFCNKGEIHSSGLNCCLFPPLALGYIVRYLRTNGFKIDQDDLNIKIHYDNYYSKSDRDCIDVAIFYNEDKILSYLLDGDTYLNEIMEKIEIKSHLKGYDVILLSLPIIFSNSSSFMFTLALARFIKKKYNPVIVLGGGNQSVELLAKYNCRDIDFVVYGDGEVMLLELLSALRHKPDLKKFLDLHIKDNNRLIATDTHPPLKPDYSGLPIEMYRYKGSNDLMPGGTSEGILEEFNRSGTLVLPFKFIKGCPSECIFCPESTNKIIHVLEPGTVALYLKGLQEEYNPTGFFFLSDTINISRQYVNDICEEIIKNGLNILWSDSARADNLDKDTVFKMRKAGCMRIILGMETASARLLRYVDKRIALKRLESILKWCDESGIWTGLEIICGLPHEKDCDVDETIDFLNRNKDYINSVYFNQFGLRDGSMLMQDPERFGIKNITEVYQYADGEFTYFHKYGYDEIGGLKWEDKKRQIISSHKKLLDNTCWDISFPIYEMEHFLFFLYSRFNDKRQIRSIFDEAVKEKNSAVQRILNNEKLQAHKVA